MSKSANNQVLEQRKALLEARLERKKSLIRQDLQDLKDDLNPFKSAGKMVKKMLNPHPESPVTNSPVLNFGINKGVGMILSRVLPGGGLITRFVAPLVVKNLSPHLLPKVKKTTERFLEWVVKKTERPATYTSVEQAHADADMNWTQQDLHLENRMRPILPQDEIPGKTY